MDGRQALYRKKIQLIHNYVESHLKDNFDMRMIADVACLSYDRFQHLYSELNREPFWAYVKRFRLENAAGLLRHSSYNIAEIGERVGYYTKSSFSKAFSQHFNTSPSAFRSLRALPMDLEFEPFQTIQCNDKLLQDSYRYEKLADSYFQYQRLSYLGPADIIAGLSGLSENQSLVVTTPDILCVTPTPRMDMGTLSAHSMERSGHNTYLEKQFTGGKYLVVSYNSAIDDLPIFIYKLIDYGAKNDLFKIREHRTFVKISGSPHLTIEIWVPT